MAKEEDTSGDAELTEEELAELDEVDDEIDAFNELDEALGEESEEEHEEGETPEEEEIEEEAKKKGGKMSKEIADDIQKALEDKDAQIAELKKAAEDEKIRLTKEHEDLKKELATERDVRLNKEFVDLVKTEMSSLPGITVEEFGPILKEMKEKLSTESYTAAYNVLKAASGYIVENGKLEKELGSSASATGNSALDKLNALTDGLIQKDTTGMSRSKAFMTVCEQNPGLYSEYNRDYKRGA
jgi:hypothetical protein